ncbi:hypothetical protein Zm00014a_028676 [Zea mays]|uniref:Uncharacterized protein n=1 Tax=Zea mays TaxID=4577 RepID=A0A3L6FW47_MAIZE|nr:hypothetical protein Zm00014a_028676 [Zea mays]
MADSGSPRKREENEEEDDIVCLDPSFFVDRRGSPDEQLPTQHPEIVKGCSVIELGSGIGITGILCSRFCKEVVLTDHNDEVLEASSIAVLTSEKLEWGNSDHLSGIIEKRPGGFDLDP